MHYMLLKKIIFFIFYIFMYTKKNSRFYQNIIKI